MACYVGLDTAKRTTKICVIDEDDNVVKEGVVETDPKAIIAFLRGDGRRYARVGMESWSLASWLYAGLAKGGLPIICIEARHSSAVLKAARTNKTDKNDARGIAEIMRVGLYKTVHIKSPESQRIKSLLTVRKFLILKMLDTENIVRGTLLIFGVKIGPGTRTQYEHRVRALVGSNIELTAVIEPLLTVWRHVYQEAQKLEQRLKDTAVGDPVCRRLMTAPGIGPLSALTFRCGVDEPGRFTQSRNVAAHFGLTPRTNQSGETSRSSGISKRGDVAVRTALFIAAQHQFRINTRTSWLKDWGLQVAERRGRMKAITAVARKLAVTLHQMWVTETDFRWILPLADEAAQTVEPAVVSA